MDRLIHTTLTPALEKKLGGIMKDLEASKGEQAFWEQVVKKACEALSAESGTFFGVSSDSRELRVVASSGVPLIRLSQATFPIQKGFCGWIARNRKAVCVNDVSQDNRFNAEVDVVTEFKTVAVLGAPVAIPERLYGILE